MCVSFPRRPSERKQEGGGGGGKTEAGSERAKRSHSKERAERSGGSSSGSGGAVRTKPKVSTSVGLPCGTVHHIQCTYKCINIAHVSTGVSCPIYM